MTAEGGVGTVTPASATNLTQLLDDSPRDRTAPLVHWSDRHWSLAAIVEAVDLLADQMRAASLRPGQPVASLVAAGPAAIVVMFAAWRNQLPYVPLNPRLSDAELLATIAEVPPALVVTSAEGRPSVTGTLPTALQHDDLSWSIDRPVDPSSPALAPDVALVMRTSGTTGSPKPVLLTHAAQLNAIDTVIAKLRDRPAGERDDRRSNAAPAATNLIPTSLALSAGIYNTLFAFRVGADVVLLDGFSTSEFARIVRTFGIRSTVLAPAMMTMLADDEQIESLAPLRFVRSITAPLLATEAQRFGSRFGVSVLNCYGQTELGGEVVGWTAADWRRFGQVKLGSVGRPHDGVDVKILAPDRSPGPDGEIGDIWIRSPFLMRGYAAAGHTVDDRLDDEGYLRTGDLGHLDIDGFLWIDGRDSDMINRGGLKVMPEEVEDVLRQHPAVRDACVAGILDTRLGEVPYAWVVWDGGPFDASGLREWCRNAMAPYKVPVGFESVQQIPRSEVGKVLRRELVRTHQVSE